MRNKAATRSVAELAGCQHGVLSAGQLEQLGYSRRRISREAMAGRLHRVHCGVYAVGHRSLTRQGLSLAAVLSCGGSALLSHMSAAWLWGISTEFLVVPEATTTSTVRHSRHDVRLHSAKTLDRDDRAVVEGVPVTAVPRTLLDMAGANEGCLRWALPRAKRLGECELDAYWADLRFAVELDTYDYHGDEISFEEDRVRQENLKLAGIEMTRITGMRMDREPAAVITRLCQLITQRRAQLER
jgi:hypothetical protein